MASKNTEAKGEKRERLLVSFDSETNEKLDKLIDAVSENAPTVLGVTARPSKQEIVQGIVRTALAAEEAKAA